MVTRNTKIHARAEAVKKYRDNNPKATKEEFKGFATGFNMGFNFMFKKYNYIKKRTEKLEAEVFALGNAMEDYKKENKELKKIKSK